MKIKNTLICSYRQYEMFNKKKNRAYLRKYFRLKLIKIVADKWCPENESFLYNRKGKIFRLITAKNTKNI